MKLKSYIGTVFAMPTTKKEYIIGLVARQNKSVLLCYFFNGVHKSIPENSNNLIDKSNVLYVCMVGALGLKNGEWHIIGKMENFELKDWLVPIFKTQDILTKEFYSVYYNEELEETHRKKISEAESKKFFDDGMAGRVYAENVISKIAYKG